MKWNQSTMDWNEIKVLWIEMKFNDCDWEIDPCNLVCYFDWIVYIIKNLFSLAYPCFSCCAWTTMTILCTRENNYTGAGESERLQSFVLSYEL